MRASLRLQADLASLVVWESIVGVGFLMALPAAFKRPSEWPSTIGVCLVAGVWVFIWIKAYKIEIEDGELRYRTLFGGTKKVLLSRIKSAKIEAGYKQYQDRFRPSIRLAIKLKDAPGVAFDINLKVFSRAGIKQLVELLEQSSKSPHEEVI